MVTYIFDWKRTIYDPENKNLVGGAMDVLEAISRKGSIMVLVGKGGREMYDEVERLGIKSFFDNIFSEEVPKRVEQFEAFVDSKQPRQTIFIGDRLGSELAIGHCLGATTLWVRQGKFANETIPGSTWIPTHAVNSISEILGHIQTQREQPPFGDCVSCGSIVI